MQEESSKIEKDKIVTIYINHLPFFFKKLSQGLFIKIIFISNQ